MLELMFQLVDEVLALNFVQVGQFLSVMKVIVFPVDDSQQRLGLPDVLAAPVAAGAAPAAGAPAAGGDKKEEKKEEKKEKKTVNIKLVKFDPKDKIKVSCWFVY